ncbi:MAG: hypothetical protein H6Q05_2975 [Acidobacteria bacterium]|jgi:hypothetical protein|nr:hypothetical protein [Acidobacteriota bacterium]
MIRGRWPERACRVTAPCRAEEPVACGSGIPLSEGDQPDRGLGLSVTASRQCSQLDCSRLLPLKGAGRPKAPRNRFASFTLGLRPYCGQTP